MTASPNPTLPFRTVAVCYHVAPARFVERLQAMAASAGLRLRGLVVDNRPDAASAPASGDLEIVGGTNRHLDFSGYFEGLERLQAGAADPAGDNVLFLNDSLLTAHAGSTILRRVLALDGLLRQLQVPAGAGKLDPYRSICLRNPWSGHASYLSTFCFLLNHPAQSILRRLVVDAEAAGVLSEVAVDDPAWGAGLDPLMREYIRAHLTYTHSPYRWRPASTAEPELIRKKARCVYFEHRLSGCLGLEGALVPINAGPRSRTGIYLRESLARIANAVRSPSR
jgi:hypothetical protein